MKSRRENEKNLTNNKGISLVSLIITIVVIIILAAIVMFNGLGTPDKANFASFVSEFSDFTLAVNNAYVNEVKENSVSNGLKSREQIYYKIATGNYVDIPEDSGKVSGLSDIYPKALNGTVYYKILKDTNVDEWKTQTKFFEKDEAHFVTDEGEVFFLPGYPVEENGETKWYINEKKYYIGKKKDVNIGLLLTNENGENLKILTNEEIGENEYLKDKTKIEMVVQALSESEEEYRVPIPKGFSYVQGTGETGLVVKDKNGNEFVWVPVSKEKYANAFGEGEYTLAGNTGVKTIKYGIGISQTMTTPGITSGYREPDIVTNYDTNSKYLEVAGYTGADAVKNFAQDMVKDFEDMVESVGRYGGFYVGRYELGYSGGVVCKPGVPGLTAATTPSTDMTNTPYYGSSNTCYWHGLYKACKSFTQGSVKSSMIYGSQWDLMVYFMGDYVLKVPNMNLTGKYGDEKKHIHDTATGLYEWTATASSNINRAIRGGRYDRDKYSVSSCQGGNAYATNKLYGTRPQLYIK